MKKWLLWITLAVVGLVVVAAVFFVPRIAGRGEVEELRTTVVERGTLNITVSASGRIEPADQVDLSFDLPGRVADVAVELGDEVEAGQPLAWLVSDDLERAVTQAELSLRQAELRLERLREPASEADIRRAENAVAQAAAALEVAQLNQTAVLNSVLVNESLEDAQNAYDDARERYEDYVRQYEDGDIDYWFVDQAQQRFEDAELALARVRQQVDVQTESASNEVERAWQTHQEAQDNLELLREGADEADLEAAQLDIEAAQLALERTRSDVADATLVAPFDGVVAAVNVTAGEIAPTGVPALSLLSYNGFHITVSVDEIDVAKLSTGLPVEVTVDAFSGQVLGGTVERIGPSAELNQGAASYPVVITLDPTETPIRAGMSATALVLVDELSDQLLIPNWVVRIDQTTGQTYVQREIAEAQIERVDVRLGVRYGGYSQVLSGVDEGDILALIREENVFSFGGQ
jgi:HlyD family secretion protein